LDILITRRVLWQVDGLAGQNPALSMGLILCGIQGFAIRSEAAAGGGTGSGCTHAEAVERIKAARRPLTLTFARSAAARSGATVTQTTHFQSALLRACPQFTSGATLCTEAECLPLLPLGLNRA
jgi:hypothetical protein